MSPSPTRVLVAGCGDLGTGLGCRLAADGASVFGLRRDPGGLPEAIRPVAADLREHSSVDEVVARLTPLDAVAVILTADERSPEAYHDTYLEGTTNLLDALDSREGWPRRLLFVSSTAVYGQRDGSWVDEDSPTEPTSGTAEVILATEQEVGRAPTESVRVRFGGIYGPGRTRLFDRVRAGEASYPEAVQYTNRIHRDDCVGVLAHLLAIDDPEPVYAAVDHEPADRKTVLCWLADRLGAPPPSPRPGTGRRGRGKRVSNQRLVASGYTFAYPTFREGYGQLLEEAEGRASHTPGPRGDRRGGSY